MFNWFKNRRRKRIIRAPWPAAWDSILENNVGHFKGLSSTEKDKLKAITKVIVSEKNWEAHGGLEMSDEIKVTISGTVALLLLGVSDFYFDRVSTIIVFPHPIRRESRDGLIVGEESHHAGEAWQSGQVVLSWQDVLSDSRNPADGRNLVIHEFAHCLDGLDGEMGGSLSFDDSATTERWQQVCNSEFEALSVAATLGQETLLDHYGATDQAEFFAVSTEAFFEQPRQLKHEHADLFDLLVEYYRVDPIEWT
jgi:Mlc titration factor MtfA (ptsG expression regulator)